MIKNNLDNTSPSKIRILTSDYLEVTDPLALRNLMLLQEKGAEIKIFQTKKDGASFHLKAYLFAEFEDGHLTQGTAFIGSSNISKMALMGGLEWNYKVSYPTDNGLLEARSRFNDIFNHVAHRYNANYFVPFKNG